MTSGPADVDGDSVIPLVMEDVSVSKRRVVTGRVRVSTVTHEREKLVDELLTQESVDIERRPIGRPVETAPDIREEGDTIVIPIVEEILVVERRLVLKEEVRVRRARQTVRHQQLVKLRQQEALVARLEAEAPASAASQPADGESREKRDRERE
ncbi:MAG TPA: DUF2382 domain-containing protein [Stellaceae bacterium]|nr:DUF2382 domain-containing protein [Stellaceae bacterium]